MRDIIEQISETLHRGKMALAKRIEDTERKGLFCVNPECLKPLSSERAAVSAWVVPDPVTGVPRKMLACSQRCHAIIHRFEAGRRVVAT